MFIMNIRNEINSIVSKKGQTFKKVCEIISEKTNNPTYNSNNLSSKISRKTITIRDVELILKELGYRIEFVEDK